MTLWLRVLVVAGIAVAGVARAERVTPTPQKPLVVKFGLIVPDDTPWADAAKRLVKHWTEASGGRLKFKLYYGGVMGDDEQHIRVCREGKVEVVGIGIPLLGGVVPELNVINLPFLLNTEQEADYVIDELLIPALRPYFREKDVELFTLVENGWFDLATTAKHPVQGPADLVGLRVRVSENQFYADAMRALGASPVPMSLHEVMDALQTGVIDGILQSQIFLFTTGWYRSLGHLSVTHVTFNPAAILISRKFMETLPPDLQAVMMSHAQEVTLDTRRSIRKIAAEVLDNFRSAGIQVHQHTPAEMAAFRKLAAAHRGTFEAGLGERGRVLLRKVDEALRRYRQAHP